MGRGQTRGPKLPSTGHPFVSESIQSKSAAEEAVHAVSWLHQMAGLPFIAGSSIVQATLGGLRRQLAKHLQVS